MTNIYHSDLQLKKETFYFFRDFYYNLKLKKIRPIFIIKETHFLFLLYVSLIWTAAFHQINYTSTGSEIVRFARATSDIINFVTLFNHLLRMLKQGSKYRSIISMMNKIFGKHFTVFNVFAGRAVNLFHCLL